MDEFLKSVSETPEQYLLNSVTSLQDAVTELRKQVAEHQQQIRMLEGMVVRQGKSIVESHDSKATKATLKHKETSDVALIWKRILLRFTSRRRKNDIRVIIMTKNDAWTVLSRDAWPVKESPSRAEIKRMQTDLDNLLSNARKTVKTRHHKLIHIDLDPSLSTKNLPSKATRSSSAISTANDSSTTVASSSTIINPTLSSDQCSTKKLRVVIRSIMDKVVCNDILAWESASQDPIEIDSPSLSYDAKSLVHWYFDHIPIRYHVYCKHLLEAFFMKEAAQKKAIQDAYRSYSHSHNLLTISFDASIDAWVSDDEAEVKKIMSKQERKKETTAADRRKVRKSGTMIGDVGDEMVKFAAVDRIGAGRKKSDVESGSEDENEDLSSGVDDIDDVDNSYGDNTDGDVLELSSDDELLSHVEPPSKRPCL